MRLVLLSALLLCLLTVRIHTLASIHSPGGLLATTSECIVYRKALQAGPVRDLRQTVDKLRDVNPSLLISWYTTGVDLLTSREKIAFTNDEYAACSIAAQEEYLLVLLLDSTLDIHIRSLERSKAAIDRARG
jgi:hypothetical protein